jgi:hypothetical protein
MTIKTSTILKLFLTGIIIILLIGLSIFVYQLIKLNNKSITTNETSIVEIYEVVNNSVVETVLIYPMKLNFTKLIKNKIFIKYTLGNLNISVFVDSYFKINDYTVNISDKIISINLKDISYIGYNLKDTIIKEDTIIKTNIESLELDKTLMEIKKDIDKYYIEDFLPKNQNMLKDKLMIKLQDKLKEFNLENKVKINWQK